MCKTTILRILPLFLLASGLFFIDSCKKEKPFVHVKGIEIAPPSLELTEGETQTLTATVLPDNADDKIFYWSSSDNQVASVSENGEVFAVKPGTVTIKATARDNGVEGICNVTVIKKIIAVSSVNLDKDELTLTEGETYTFSATVLPEDADDKSLTWTSSATEIATVDDKGEVTSLKPGETVITAASVFDPEKKASCTLTVAKKLIPVESVSLDKTAFSLTVGQNYTLTASVLPDNASDKSVTWESSNIDVAMVSAGKVVGSGVGTAVITAKSVSDPDKTASCTVTVESDVVDVTGISLTPASATIEVNKTCTLTASVEPANATNPKVRWEVSPEGIVSVDAAGVLTGIKTGSATVTATTQDGGFSKNCEVAVVDNAITAITFEDYSSTSVPVEYGSSREVQVKITPADASNKEVTWTAGNGIRISSYGTDESGAPKATIIFDKGLTGEYDLTATSVVTTDKKVSQRFKIWCNPSAISVPPAYVSQGGTFKLAPVFTPSYTTEKDLSYESSNTDVASVSGTGLVEGKSIGTATITITSKAAPSVSTTCEVSVITENKVIINGGDPIVYETGKLADAIGSSTVTSIAWTQGLLNEDDVAAFNEKCRGTAVNVDISKVGFVSTGKKYKITGYSTEYSFTSGELPPAMLAIFTKMSSLTLPPVSALGNYSIARTAQLKTLTLPTTVNRIGSQAFSNSGLASIVLPPSVKIIDGYAFSNTSLEGTLDLRYVEKLGSEVFSSAKLKKIIFGAALKSYGFNAISGSVCKALTAFEFAEDNALFKAVNGWLLSKDGTTLYQVPMNSAGATGGVLIPEGVKTIMGGIFWGLNVTNVALPEGLESISGMYAFGSYKGTSLVLPSTLKTIHSLAFNYSTSLKEVTCKAVTPPTVTDGYYEIAIFGKDAPIESIYVPAESVEAYKKAAGWSKWAEFFKPIP